MEPHAPGHAHRRLGVLVGLASVGRLHARLLAMLIVALSLCDLALTRTYLLWGGHEANPLMALALEKGEEFFTAAKLGMTWAGAMFLLRHQDLRIVQVALVGLVALYVGLILFHLFTWIPTLLGIF